MTPSAAYGKTPKGEEEIATRRYRLSPRERSLLVMSDGRISGADLAKRAAVLGDPDALLGALIGGGFIEAIEPPAPAEPAVAVFGSAHQEAARFASRYLLDALGPASDMIGAWVEACRDPEQLMGLIEKCREAIQVGVGARKAEDFQAGVVARLSGQK
jgi:hypothetical protein